MLLFALLSLAMNVSARPLSAAALLHSPTRHVRTTDRVVAGLLQEGIRRSGTFAQLARQLEYTDVLVYIERVAMPSGLDGRLVIVRRTNTQRYLRVQISDRPPVAPTDVIALIAHELRHALEIAGAPDVRDDATLAAFYTRIGEHTRGENFYDTVAARATAASVRKELVA